VENAARRRFFVTRLYRELFRESFLFSLEEVMYSVLVK